MKQFYMYPLSFYLSSFMPFIFLFMDSRTEPTSVITVSVPFYIKFYRDTELLLSTQTHCRETSSDLMKGISICRAVTLLLWLP